jgi:hypothetical protein
MVTPAGIHPETQFPLPWREGIKGRGNINYTVSFYLSPPPSSSPVKGEEKKGFSGWILARYCLSCLILGLVIICLHLLLIVWPATSQQVFTDSIRVS